MNANGEEGARTLRFAVLFVTYMQSASLPLPNAVLRFIQGALSMSDDQAGWVFTSYLAASAITLPLAQWLAGRYGLKVVYQAAIACFAVGLLLATQATTALAFVGARIVQGAASGVLAPLSMAIALETLPPARRGSFSSIWTAIVLLGIVSGPGLGGWLGEFYGWRSIFYISLPLSAFIFLVVTLLLQEKKAEKRPSFDFFGFGCFTLGMIGLQMLLDRGERLEWFASLEVWLEAVACATGLYLFVVHVLTAKVHFLSKGLFRDRNFVLSTVMFFALGFVLLSTMALTSPMLDELLGFPPDTTGFLTIPRGVGTGRCVPADGPCGRASRPSNLRGRGHCPGDLCQLADARLLAIDGLVAGSGGGCAPGRRARCVDAGPGQSGVQHPGPEAAPGRDGLLQSGPCLRQHDRRGGGAGQFLQQHAGDAFGAGQPSERVSHGDLDVFAGIGRAQRNDHRPGGLHRNHRPVQAFDVGDVAGVSAGAAASQTRTDQLVFVESGK